MIFFLCNIKKNPLPSSIPSWQSPAWMTLVLRCRRLAALIQHINIELALAYIIGICIQAILEGFCLVLTCILTCGRGAWSCGLVDLHMLVLDGARSHHRVDRAMRHCTPCSKSHALRYGASQTCHHAPSSSSLLHRRRRWRSAYRHRRWSSHRGTRRAVTRHDAWF